eukprot:TRINITY_DN11656_c0_g1_i1.p1 TRINITY_DN11656_c0_g1~~TRINITY_DN11656_c0_g1_i1.p1  ORF type:complete len:709 (+),score=217.10 TRINITY_DN11656_c0_g1_i1:182-2308(+)
MLYPRGAENSIVALATDCLEMGALFGGFAALSEHEHELMEEEEEEAHRARPLQRRPSRQSPAPEPQPAEQDRELPSPTHATDRDVSLATPRQSPPPSPSRKQEAARERWATRRSLFAGVVGGPTGRLLCIGLRVSGAVTELGFLVSMAVAHAVCWCLRRCCQGLSRVCRLCGANTTLRTRVAAAAAVAGMFVAVSTVPVITLTSMNGDIEPECVSGFVAGWSFLFVAAVGSVFIPFVLSPQRMLGALLFADEALWFIDKFTMLTLRVSYVVTHGVVRWLREGLMLGRHLSLSAALAAVGAAAFRESVSAHNRHAIMEAVQVVAPIAKGIAAPLRLGELGDSWRAVAKLQQAAGLAPVGQPPSCGPMRPASEWSERIGYDLSRAFKFALATYGHMGLKFLGVLPYADHASNNARAAKLCSGLPIRSIVVSDQRARVFQPAYIVWRDDAGPQKSIIVGIRGSVRLEDWLTDFICSTEPCALMGCSNARAHAGMMRSARGLADRLTSVVQELLLRFPRHSLVVCGHSLGAGTATLLSAIWLTEGSMPAECRVRERLRCFAFGVPPPCTPCLAKALEPYCTSFQMGADLVPRLSQETINMLRDQVFALWRERGADAVMKRCAEAQPGDAQHKAWAKSELVRLAVGSEKAVELRAPGLCLWWRDVQGGEFDHDLKLARVHDPTDLDQIILTRFAIIAHMPQCYGAPLHALPDL